MSFLPGFEERCKPSLLRALPASTDEPPCNANAEEPAAHAPVPSFTSLEEQENNSTGCGGAAFGLIEWSGEVARYVPLRCKSWNCEYCCKRNGKKLLKRLRDSGVDFHRMMTLPFHITEERTWEDAIRESGSTLNRFFTYLRRVIPGIRYFWVREIGKKSLMVHFHVMVSMYLPQAFISEVWLRSGGGSVCDIREAGMGYALKYLVKFARLPQCVYNVLKGKRRWACSRNLLVAIHVMKTDGNWEFITGNPRDWPWVTIEEEKDGILYIRAKRRVA